MATAAATPINGFEWRTLLGNTHDWTLPPTELSTAAQPANSVASCALCGEPIGDGKPFFTNSAGERPIHIACSQGEPTPVGLRPARKTWLRLLQSFVTG